MSDSTPILTTLVNFDGIGPNNEFVIDANGDLIGTGGGGTSGDGVVFEIANNGTAANPSYSAAPTVLVDFNGTDGNLPFGLVADANGNLFGVTGAGGAFGSFPSSGTVFEIANNGTVTNPNYATTPTVLTSFSEGASGGSPTGGLIADANGDLFGTTTLGGAFDAGTVFEIKNNGTVASPNYAAAPTVLVNFNLAAYPGSGVFADANGDLFGTMGPGFSGTGGSFFELKNNGTAADPNYAAAPTILFQFGNGSGPSQLITDANGDFFGTTPSSESSNGTVFEIKNSGTAANPQYSTTVLVRFNGANGANPGGLIMDANGDLFGVTDLGGAFGDGTVFMIANNGTAADPNYATTPIVLVSFDGTNGYATGLFTDANGDLLGTTGSGGASGDGTIFQLATPIIGTAQDGQTLRATAFGNPVSYQWRVLVGGNWVDVAGATDASYAVQSGDVGRQIDVVVTDASGHSVTSAATTSVLDANGNQPVYETDTGSVIGNGQLQYVFGTATNTTVNNGGEQNVYAGGTAVGASINAGGAQVDWGTATGTMLDGGNQYVWSTATGTTVNRSGTQYVENGGIADGTTVGTGGAQVVYTGGSVSGTILDDGAQYIYDATTADQTTINAGGLQYLFTTATNTTINTGGEQNVYAGATAIGSAINLGGRQVDWGTASNTTLDGGDQYVWGNATDTTVNSGTQRIGGGGIADGTIINDGGTEHVYTGGTAEGVTFGGPSATLVLDQASELTGAISGFQSSDTIDLSFVAFDGATTTLGYQANSSGPAGGTLTVTDGSHTAMLALLGNYSAASFALSSDGIAGTVVTMPNMTTENGLAAPLHS